MENPTRSKPKLLIIEFIKQTKDGEFFEFVIIGDTKVAANFVHRMRVELARLRDQVRMLRGKRANHFMMLVDSYTEVMVDGQIHTTVRLKRTKSRKDLNQKTSEALDMLEWNTGE